MATIKTRKEAGGYQWTHEVEFDFTTLTDEQKTELMTASAIIRWQARARKLEGKELDRLAGQDVVKVDAATLFERATAGPQTPEKLVARMTPEQQKELLATLQKQLGVK